MSRLGTVLVQLDDNNREYMVAYASRSLNKNEKNYSISELECLVVIWAMEHFHQYLGSRPLFLITDHSVL